MKALSIQQPWAHAILRSGKDIENRTWTTSYRGPLLIHAGKRYDDAGPGDLVRMGERFKPKSDAQLGGIVGIVWLGSIVQASASRWFGGPYGWVVGHAQPVPFTPLRGHLGLFNVDVDGLPAETAAEIRRWVRGGL